MKEKNEQLFEKKITLENYSDYDFVGSDGKRMQLLKIMYSYRDEKGLRTPEIRIPYECLDKIKDLTFPKQALIVFTIDDLSKRPTIVDLKVLGN